jgi:hypothetical protein
MCFRAHRFDKIVVVLPEATHNVGYECRALQQMQQTIGLREDAAEGNSSDEQQRFEASNCPGKFHLAYSPRAVTGRTNLNAIRQDRVCHPR